MSIEDAKKLLQERVLSLQKVLDESKIASGNIGVYDLGKTYLSLEEIKEQREVLESAVALYKHYLAQGKYNKDMSLPQNQEADAEIMQVLSQNRFLANFETLTARQSKNELSLDSDKGMQTAAIGVASGVAILASKFTSSLGLPNFVSDGLKWLGTAGLSKVGYDVLTTQNPLTMWGKDFMSKNMSFTKDYLTTGSLGQRAKFLLEGYDKIIKGEETPNCKSEAVFKQNKENSNKEIEVTTINEKNILLNGKPYSFKEIFEQYEILAKIRRLSLQERMKGNYTEEKSQKNQMLDVEFLKALQENSFLKDLDILQLDFEPKDAGMIGGALNSFAKMFGKGSVEKPSLGHLCEELCNRYEDFLFRSHTGEALIGDFDIGEKATGVTFPKLSLVQNEENIRLHKINSSTFSKLREEMLDAELIYEKELAETLDEEQAVILNKLNQAAISYDLSKLTVGQNKKIEDFLNEKDLFNKGSSEEIFKTPEEAFNFIVHYIQELLPEASETFKGLKAQPTQDEIAKIGKELKNSLKLSEIVQGYFKTEKALEIVLKAAPGNAQEMSQVSAILGYIKKACESANISLKPAKTGNMAKEALEKLRKAKQKNVPKQDNPFATKSADELFKKAESIYKQLAAKKSVIEQEQMALQGNPALLQNPQEMQKKIKELMEKHVTHNELRIIKEFNQIVEVLRDRKSELSSDEQQKMTQYVPFVKEFEEFTKNIAKIDVAKVDEKVKEIKKIEEEVDALIQGILNAATLQEKAKNYLLVKEKLESLSLETGRIANEVNDGKFNEIYRAKLIEFLSVVRKVQGIKEEAKKGIEALNAEIAAKQGEAQNLAEEAEAHGIPAPQQQPQNLGAAPQQEAQPLVLSAQQKKEKENLLRFLRSFKTAMENSNQETLFTPMVSGKLISLIAKELEPLVSKVEAFKEDRDIQKQTKETLDAFVKAIKDCTSDYKKGSNGFIEDSQANYGFSVASSHYKKIHLFDNDEIIKYKKLDDIRKLMEKLSPDYDFCSLNQDIGWIFGATTAAEFHRKCSAARPACLTSYALHKRVRGANFQNIQSTGDLDIRNPNLKHTL